jgi:cell division protein FtsB|tara:strand:+ start:315 stop:551 length:237 start_codon:yes stop_codon:yes gene_type:complete
MKTLKSRSTTSRKKKLTDAEKVKFLERELHFHIMRGDSRFVSNGRREVKLRTARKQNRELKREVMRLNERVMKLVDKI